MRELSLPEHRSIWYQVKSAGAVNLPVYSHTAALTGSAILIALCLVVLIALVVGWWRRR